MSDQPKSKDQRELNKQANKSHEHAEKKGVKDTKKQQASASPQNPEQQPSKGEKKDTLRSQEPKRE